MSAELTLGQCEVLQGYSFIALKQYLEQQGVSSSFFRYRATPSLAHPAGEVSAVAHDGESSLITIDVGFMGLYGTLSPMPVYYTESVLDEVNHGGGSEQSQLKPFYDLFNHQAVSLFYDAWCKYKLPYRFSLDGNVGSSEVAPENNNNARLGDEFINALLGLWGFDLTRLKNLRRLTVSHLLSLAGLLACRLPSAELVSQALTELFPSVDIELCVLDERLIAISIDQLSRLGISNVALGDTSMIGEQVTDCSGLNVHITLNDPADLKLWLPNGYCNEMARELISLLLGTAVDYQLVLSFKEDNIAATDLGSEHVELGWNSCLAESSRLTENSYLASRSDSHTGAYIVV